MGIYYKFNKALSPTMCKEIIELGKDTWEKAGVKSNGKRLDQLEDIPEDGNLNLDIRKSEIAFCNEQWLYNTVFDHMAVANKNNGWNYEISSAQPMQITKYEVGGHFDYHSDGHGSIPINDTENKFTNGNTRKLSMSLMLNDNYKGGEFQFYKQPKLKEKRGTMLFFPSFMLHKVNPVESGTRYALVVWFLGKPFR